LVNEQIRHKEVRVLYEDVDKVMLTKDALELAEENGLDLVLVSDSVVPPICKILNYSKLKYEKDKRAKANKSSRQAELKEVTMGCQIMDHDIVIKANTAKRLLEEGHKVKVTIRFRGREKAYINNGPVILNKCIHLLSQVAITAGPIKTENNQVYVMLNPK
jgi:translation initiation factor IF-3